MVFVPSFGLHLIGRECSTLFANLYLLTDKNEFNLGYIQSDISSINKSNLNLKMSILKMPTKQIYFRKGSQGYAS